MKREIRLIENDFGDWQIEIIRNETTGWAAGFVNIAQTPGDIIDTLIDELGVEL